MHRWLPLVSPSQQKQKANLPFVFVVFRLIVNFIAIVRVCDSWGKTWGCLIYCVRYNTDLGLTRFGYVLRAKCYCYYDFIYACRACFSEIKETMTSWCSWTSVCFQKAAGYPAEGMADPVQRGLDFQQMGQIWDYLIYWVKCRAPLSAPLLGDRQIFWPPAGRCGHPLLKLL